MAVPPVICQEWNAGGSKLECGIQFEVRIVEIDGQAKMLTMDAKTNRINFRVRDGYVTAVYGG